MDPRSGARWRAQLDRQGIIGNQPGSFSHQPIRQGRLAESLGSQESDRLVPDTDRAGVKTENPLGVHRRGEHPSEHVDPDRLEKLSRRQGSCGGREDGASVPSSLPPECHRCRCPRRPAGSPGWSGNARRRSLPLPDRSPRVSSGRVGAGSSETSSTQVGASESTARKSGKLESGAEAAAQYLVVWHDTKNLSGQEAGRYGLTAPEGALQTVPPRVRFLLRNHPEIATRRRWATCSRRLRGGEHPAHRCATRLSFREAGRRIFRPRAAATSDCPS